MEQLLNPNDSCRLMAINLFSFVDEPFTKQAVLNKKKLYEVSYEHARLGDSLVDLELEYIQRIIDKIKSDPEPDNIKRGELDLWEKSYFNTKAGRRIGLGITGLADMVAALGFGYDSKEGLEVIDLAMRTKMEAELDCTIDLAILRGSFEGWDVYSEFYGVTDGKTSGVAGGNNNFYQFIYNEFPEQAKRMYKYGRRNVSWSTIAPTGSVSILTQTTSGCEPLFQPFYMRRKKINPNEIGVRVDFVDEIGDSWQEFPVLHEKFKEWCTKRLPELDLQYWGKDIDTLSQDELSKAFRLSPWYGSTANEIDWIKRNEVQAILQKYTSNAISSTINLPSTVTEQEVSDIYMDGWSRGLKGQTVYVDGSRSGVLVSKDDKGKKDKSFTDNNAPKRPKKLEAEIIRFQNNLEKWIAVVGLIDGRPYEFFTGKLEGFPDIPISVSKGLTVKNKEEGKQSRYDFEYKDKDGNTVTVKGLSRSFNEEYWNYARMISGVLRHGMPLPYVVELVNSLNLEGDAINTWKNGVARVIKKFIPDGTAGSGDCPECKQGTLVFQEGCLTCKSCGHSKCG